MKKVRVLSILLLVILPGSQALATVLKSAQVNLLPSGASVVRLSFDDPGDDFEPRAFSVSDPPVISLDLPHTGLAAGVQRMISVPNGIVSRVRIVSSKDRARIVLRLRYLASHDTWREGNDFFIRVPARRPGEEAPLRSPDPPRAAPPPVESAAAPVPEGDAAPKAKAPKRARKAQSGGAPFSGKLKGVTFSLDGGRPEHADLHIRVDGDVDMSSEAIPGGVIEVVLGDTRVPERFRKRFITTDFGTPVQKFEIEQNGRDARILVYAKGDVEHSTWQIDGDIHVKVAPRVQEDQSSLPIAKRSYVGSRISLNFQNIEVRSVIQLIGEVAGLNVVATDSVTGSITIRLKDLPWDQALDIILLSRGLGKRQEGNVLYVAPIAELARRNEEEARNRKKREEAEPLVLDRIQINYAKAQDIAQILQGAGKEGEDGIVSPRGKITVDPRTNTLLVLETRRRIDRMRKLVMSLDIPVRQVKISSRIVLARESFSKNLGVKFGYSRITDQNTANNGGFFGMLGGKRPGDVDYGGPTAFQTNNLENYIVDLPVAGVTPAAALGLSIGKIGSQLLQLELSAAQAEGKTEVISSPTVITADRKEAVIEQGTEIPYQEASSSGATSVSFKKAVLSLKVTPQITPDNRIIMDLDISKDKVGEVFNGVPSIDTQSVKTQVLVKDGETVVLGGIYTRDKGNQVDKVPLFGDLPYLGRLFRRTGRSSVKDELLIFVTPRIVRESLSLPKIR